MKKLVLIILLLLSFSIFAKSIIFEKIYLDEIKNVHLITKDGKNIKLTKDGKSTRIALSQDKKTAAWLTEQAWLNENEEKPGASRLTIYRNQKMHAIDCLPFIREYWFWENGEKIAIFCGGLHFGGTYLLYDSSTGILVESFHQADVKEEERPAWSLPGSSYHPEDIY